MTPDDPVERLFALEQFGIKLGLDNIRRLLDALGHPERGYTVAHVAGTNGKGSVTAMVECGLRHAGLSTGRYTSPHLAHIEERIAIDGRSIASGKFREITTDVLAAVDHLRAMHALEATPTFFEVTTAVAFEAFRRAKVDAAVIEVGLGGRFDATNVVRPAVTAITSIGLDHQQYLGNTLTSIAFEKAGILKSGVPAIVGDVQPEPRGVIEDVARGAGARIVDAGSGLLERSAMSDGHAVISLTTPRARYRDVRLALSGRHQVGNALVAVRVLETLADAGLAVQHDDIVAALTQVQWPARLEWLRLDATRHLLLDAAHNVAGARALAEYLADSGVAPLPIVLAVMRDKDVPGIVSALAPAASHVIATSVGTPRALPAAALADEIRGIAPALATDAVDDPDAAVSTALRLAPRAAVAGSIFLVGPLRDRLLAAGALSLQAR